MVRSIADAVTTAVVYGTIVVVMGCAQSSTEDLQPFVAVTGNYGVEESPHSPTPAPEPEGDKCEICRGTGKADGRATCPACNGTGKKTKAKATSIGQTIIVHPPAGNCTTGTCSTPRIAR